MKKLCKTCQTQTKHLFGDCQVCQEKTDQKKVAAQAVAKKAANTQAVLALYNEMVNDGYDEAPVIAKKLKLPINFVKGVLAHA
jgi:hypothetical protein